MLGVSHTQVRRYLNGEAYPPVQQMLLLEQWLGWPVRDQIGLVPLEGINHVYGLAFTAILEDENQE